MGYEKTFAAAAGIAAGTVGLYKWGEDIYRKDLAARLPEGGTEEPIFPYLEAAVDTAYAEGLEVELMGGPVKQALCDPETIIDSEAKEIRVSDNPDCRVRKKGTLYRPGELTLRDADFFAKRILVDGKWQPTLPTYDKLLGERTETVQLAADEAAELCGFPQGPEVSMFGYEECQGPFSVSHYATVTEYVDGFERMSHSLGASETFSPQDEWTFVINTPEGQLRIPTSSPVRLLGRTYVRSLVLRERDRDEVNEAVGTIIDKGQYDELLGEEWNRYRGFRQMLDATFRARKFVELVERGEVKTGVNLLLGKLLAPLAPKIEESYLGAMIRDPGSKLYPYTSKIMGARSAENTSS